MRFTLDEDKLKKIGEWLNEHDKTCKFASRLSQGACGGRLSYMFTPTDIGVVTKVKCACGEEKDLTDYENW